MRHKLVSRTDKNFRYVNSWDSTGSDNNHADRLKMSELLHRAMKEGLTDKQRYCVIEYYIKNKSMKKIASELGVYPSTVTRHIQSATKRLRNIAKYYN